MRVYLGFPLLHPMLLLLVVVVVIDPVKSHGQTCTKNYRAAHELICSTRNKRDSESPAKGGLLIDRVLRSTSRAEFPSAIERQTMTIREIIVSSSVPVVYQFQPYPAFLGLPRESAPAPPVPPVVDAAPPRIASLPEESGSHVGFDISYEEEVELFNEIYERTPRALRKPRADAQRDFHNSLIQCCRGFDTCVKNAIPSC